MAFIGPWGQFIHIPKCAGVAMREYLKNRYRTDGIEYVGMHDLPPEIDNAFTIVRHPADWLVSFYAYYFESHWFWEDLPAYIDEQFSFAKGYFWPSFVDAVLEKNPGAIGKVFDYYCQPGVKVYKIDELSDHFEGIMKKHDTNNKPLMTAEQRKRICKAEKKALKRYGYADND